MNWDLEAPEGGIQKLVVNDYSEDAFIAMKRNMEYNGAPMVAVDEGEARGLAPSQVCLVPVKMPTPHRMKLAVLV